MKTFSLVIRYPDEEKDMEIADKIDAFLVEKYAGRVRVKNLFRGGLR